MTLPYIFRLVCLCGAAFFIIHLALSMLVRMTAGLAVRLAAHMKPAGAARLLFTLRLAPVVLTAFVLLAFCIPSYLWLEPRAGAETIGAGCVVLALLGAAVWAAAVWRVSGAVRGTNEYLHQCERQGRRITVPGDSGAALLLDDKAAVVAVAGVLRPQLVISSRVMQGLTDEQREAALRHERAHCASADNLKRLLILLAPEALPWVPAFRNLERAWSKFTEWSADDQACQGDSQRALSLADALVTVAKMGSKPRRAYLACSLVGDDKELSERVDRLLRPQPTPEKPVKEVVTVLSGAAALAASGAAVVLLWPSSLTAVHQVLERLVH